MSDYGGDDEYGDDWLYVDDYYDEADELAEYTCPSPAYFEEGKYGDNDDIFEYFADLDYLSDGGYFDNRDPDARRTKRRKLDSSPQQKRKHKDAMLSSKSYPDPVLWMSNQERDTAVLESIPTIKAGGSEAFGLLKNWRMQFRDHHGLASFPEGDFQLEDHQQHVEDDEDGEVTGEGFDLGDLQKVAEMLGGENMEALKKIMEAQGMDPEAVQEVLKDMMEGKEREFDDDDEDEVVMEEEEEEDDDDEGAKDEAEEMHIVGENAQPPLRGGRRAARRGVSSGKAPSGTTKTPNQPVAHTAKRKIREQNGEASEEESMPAVGRKRQKVGTTPRVTALPASSSSISDEPSIPTHRTRSGKGRKQ